MRYNLLFIAFALACATCVSKKLKFKHNLQSNDPLRFTLRPTKSHFLKPLIWKLKYNVLRHGIRPKKGTPKKVDLLFLVEGSKAVGAYEYRRIIFVIRRIINFFSVSPGTTRIAFIKFDTTAETLIKFDDYHNREAITRQLFKVSRKPVTKTSGLLAVGLERAAAEFRKFTRPSTTRIMITFTAERHDSHKEKKRFDAALKVLESLKVQRSVIAIKQSSHFSKHPGKSVFARALANKKHFYSITKRSLRYLPLLFPKASYPYCPYRNGKYYDECHQRCSCVYGHVRKCYRVRQEWNSMSTEQRKRYIDTYIKLTTDPVYRPRYERFIRIHSINFDTPIHEGVQFLPWHRWYMNEFENLLKEVDCRVTVPYWDWSMVSNDPWNETMLFSPHPHGFGTVNFEISECVITGPFASPNWILPDGRCLERWMDGFPPNAADVQAVYNVATFQQYEVGLRIILHDTVHCLIGGTMCSAESASAPEFFLHHGFIDKLWGDAQKKNAAFHNGFWKDSNAKMLASPYSAKQVLNLNFQPGYIRISYTATKINHALAIKKALAAKPAYAVQHMPRRRTQTMSEAAMKLFKVSKKDYNMAYKLQDYLKKHKIIRHGFSKQTGLPMNVAKSA